VDNLAAPWLSTVSFAPKAVSLLEKAKRTIFNQSAKR
jgi:hypothetical protein